MNAIYRCGYEYDAQGHGGCFYILADDYGQADAIAQVYFEEEYLADRALYDIEKVKHRIGPGELLLYLE